MAGSRSWIRRRLATLRTSSGRLVTTVVSVVGVDELLLVVALALVTVALWPRFERLALLVPGLVILWVVLPSRSPFVARPPTATKAERRQD